MINKKLQVNIEILDSNTPQKWEFTKEVSGVEQLALWVILKELCEKNIKKMIS